MALGSLLRSLEVDFFAIQEPHFVTAEDRQAGTRCLSKYRYGLDGPLHEEGRGGVALAWKTSCKLQPGLFVSTCRGRRCPFSHTFVRGIDLVMTTLAALWYTPLHQGAVWAQRQSVRLADLGQRSAVYIPWCMVAFGTAHGHR